MDKLYPANVVLSGEDGFLENYFYCAKASKKEKDLGLEEHNLHPTIKPIKLIEYLATLLLPPQAYSPRKLLVPFAGTGSEMIGALKSGWDYVEGVELEKDSAEVGAKRLAYWVKDENN
jgi:DNA modification methylase